MIPKQSVYAFQATLKRFGKTALVSRYQQNALGEFTDELSPVATLKGIHHSTSLSVKTLKTADSAVYNSIRQPMLMCLYEDAKQVLVGDIVAIEGVEFKVSGLQDIYGDKSIIDLSLEEIQKSPNLVGGVDSDV